MRDDTLLTRSQELGHGSVKDAMAAMGNSPPLSTINMQRNILAMLMAVNQQLGWVEARLERVEGRMSEKAVWPPAGPAVVIDEWVPNYVGYPLCEKAVCPPVVDGKAMDFKPMAPFGSPMGGMLTGITVDEPQDGPK